MKNKKIQATVIFLCVLLLYSFVSLYQRNNRLEDHIVSTIRDDLMEIKRLTTINTDLIQQSIESQEISSEEIDKLLFNHHSIRDSIITITKKIEILKSREYVKKYVDTGNLSMHSSLENLMEQLKSYRSTPLKYDDLNSLKSMQKGYELYSHFADITGFLIINKEKWINVFNYFYTIQLLD